MTALQELLAFNRTTEALGQVMGRLGWDQETFMPPGAAEQRGEEMAALEGVLHARRTDPKVGEWLAAAKPETEAEAAQLREIGRGHARAVKVPAELASELARLTSVSQGIWARARAEEDVAAFLPTLSQVVALRREEAAAIADGGDLYDALLQDYEPGATAAEIAALFDRMRPRLKDLRSRLAGAKMPTPLQGHFAADAQMALAHETAERFGYDFAHGRLDLAVHPFSSGSGADVRITTRVDEGEPMGCLYSTIHEVGHACYEQNIAPALRLSALGQGVSMGVHESQSRIYENQLGRSPEFCRFLHGRMEAHFGALSASQEEIARVINRVETGFIRTEADEVHYNLHIMLRFDLERQLFDGTLEVADLEEAWNDRFAADFGMTVDKPSNGVLQDVHWSVGLFGYFPTYTLGNVYAGCLYAALRRDVPGLDAALAAGDPAPALDWLRERLQRHGGLRTPRETIEHATGAEISEEHLLAYLEAKYGALFGL
ncbi:carboxypeptidase M32 [Gymnodinialimonas ceratoperidinii]|uniref:Metal-dependent carboxypeptidase n=1 Tax=Gymnodinialimonas ceratoperidinii TaxID=2856823 RepID=A0A8F6TTJ8_9RHOB|nr:carboxypeptidase M32 [Gymnodinialimonas ceratoperidinii]QXT38450.1 carboxypeptidase M32 [Gymnodinialimonas ceratoperidinii]